MSQQSATPSGTASEAGTPARSRPEARIAELMTAGGIFVEAVCASRLPLAVTDPTLPDNPIVFVNGAFLELSGYGMDEVLGRQPFFMDGDETDRAEALRFREALEQDRDEVIETVQYRKDGSRFTASIFLSAFKGEDGRTLHQFLSYLDVTRRVAAEDEVASRARIEARLRESEERHRLLVNSWAQAVWETDADGVVVADSPSWRAYTGQTREQWLGYGWLDAVHPDDRDHAGRQWREAVEARAPVNAEFRLRAPDGGWRWTNVRAAPILDAHGRVEKWAGMNIDVDARRRAEAALRDSEERFRSMAEAIEDVFYITDLDRGGLVYLSPAYEGIWGRPTAELQEDLSRFPDAVHPDDRPRFDAGKTAQARGEPVAVEYRIVRPDGDVRWILDRSFPVAGSEGRRSAGVASDITRRHEVEERVRASEALLRQFGDASSDVLWIRDAETLRWEYLSPAFEAIYGEGIGKALTGESFGNWTDLIVDADRGTAVANIERVRAGECVTFDYRVRRPCDGEIRWLRDTDFPMRGPGGEVERIGGVGHDATELKRTEAALRAGEERLQTLMEGIPQLVWRACSEGRRTWSSPQWQQFTGQTQQASHGTGWLDAVHPDDRDVTMRAWEAARPGGMLDVEYRVRRASDDAYLWHHTRSVPLRDAAGRVVEWLGTTTDVQELKELQERQAVLVAELQHRTRNLMGVIQAMSDKTARASADLPDFRSRFRDRLDALARVQGLLSRLNEHDRVTFDDLIRTELSAMDGDLGRVTLEGPSGVRLRSSSVQMLAMALHELATNAVKYGALGQPLGRLSVRWSLGAGEEGKPWLNIDWRESGVDMPAGPPPHRTGQGRELIERALPYQLSAKTSYALGPDGVHCTISVGVSAGKAEAEDHA